MLAVAAQVAVVNVEKSGERFVIEGEVTVGASAAAVYGLITDYDSLSNLDKGIAESRLVERVSDDTAMVYTSMTGCIILFCRKVNRLERVAEVSSTEVVAEVVPSEDSNVSYGRSQWQIYPQADGTRVVFSSELEPDFWIPAFMGNTLMKQYLRKRVSRTLLNLEHAAQPYEP